MDHQDVVTEAQRIAEDMDRASARLRHLAQQAGPGPTGLYLNSLATQQMLLAGAARGLRPAPRVDGQPTDRCEPSGGRQ